MAAADVAAEERALRRFEGQNVKELPSAPPPPHIVDAATFLGEFKPIESLIDGLPIPRGGLVSITGLTGGGKTTLCASIETALTSGSRFAGRDCTPQHGGASQDVLVLAGENPDDYAMHLMATLQLEGLSAGEIDGLFIVPGTFDFQRELDRVHAALAGRKRNLCAVFVDTSAAFYAGDDENDNVAMHRHAAGLRELCSLPGKPTTFVLCHPIKNATRENLLPRGGGAFLNEVDANLTVWKDETGVVTLHWAGKIRGASFDPIRFELVPVELAGVVDCRGRPIYSVAARHLADERAEQLQAKEVDDENRLLIAMQRKPRASVRDLAMACGWTNGSGKPLSTRVDRRLKRLKDLGLADQDRQGTWELTSKGRKEADKLP